MISGPDFFSFQQAQLGWNYLDYEDGWPKPLGGENATSSSPISICKMSGWSSVTIILGKFDHPPFDCCFS